MEWKLGNLLQLQSMPTGLDKHGFHIAELLIFNARCSCLSSLDPPEDGQPLSFKRTTTEDGRSEVQEQGALREE
jgi:hypothetical protein